VQDLSSFLREMRLVSHVLLRTFYRILEKYTLGAGKVKGCFYAGHGINNVFTELVSSENPEQ
jgi:hypothetical protein